MKQDIILKLLEMLINADDAKSTEVKPELVEFEWSHPLKGQPVIVRCRDAGVHFGYLKHFEGRVVELERSRRMWRWWTKKQMTLSAVAEFGLNPEKDLRIQNELELIILQDACEIIPCSVACVDSINKVEPYDEQ